MSGFDVSDARVVVTGASAGLGRALSVQLAERGARVALVARGEDALRRLATELEGRAQHPPLVVAADLSEPGTPAAVAAHVLEEFGCVDLLVNNAGSHFVESLARVGDGPSGRELFELHLWAPLALTSEVLPTMLANGRGAILNVTATMENLPIPFAGYYTASKSAIAQATRVLRHELRHTPIRVIEFSPGPNDTAARKLGTAAVPWKTGPPPMFPSSPESSAAAVLRALERGAERITHPAFARIQAEVPVLGRFIAAIAARQIDTSRPVARPTS
ncbi:SDR family NAD(P)-dependent oxidoreductase [Mycobacterium sp. 134]|uniref:SDR family NAD(P)-dependent oxidoreductase n=1 Tax=Mycobacterium sp. 134 TaxID=3400425 RepID=UPI003AAD7848